jgi:hypothetical protein
MQPCHHISEALTFTPVLLRRGRHEQISIPVHDGPVESGRLGRSDIRIHFCPWCGTALTSDHQAEPHHQGGGSCELMRYYLGLEDEIVFQDHKTGTYTLPLFNGPPERHCLGYEGLALYYCPWCGDAVHKHSNPTNQLSLDSFRTQLPAVD